MLCRDVKERLPFVCFVLFGLALASCWLTFAACTFACKTSDAGRTEHGARSIMGEEHGCGSCAM